MLNLVVVEQEQVIETIRLVLERHATQVDKAGRPYVLHLLAVMNNFDDHIHQIVALLHDIVEDDHSTLEELVCLGYSDIVVAAVDAISRREDETYFTFIERVKLNEVARQVKLADIRHNLSRNQRDIGQDLVRRYEKAISLLEQS